MKLPANFYRPLAIGAPLPLRELPVRPERMIHFFPPHVEKIRARIPEMAKQIDVLCGNLEDAIPIDAKEAARAGFIAVAQSTDFGGTALWTRVNALNSPWFLDDVLEIVAAVIIVPKVEGPWDIHFVDQLLAQLEARHKVTKPILIHALLETAQGVKNVPRHKRVPRGASSASARDAARINATLGPTCYFMALAAALATCPSCWGSIPETPTAPTSLPSTRIGTPPS